MSGAVTADEQSDAMGSWLAKVGLKENPFYCREAGQEDKLEQYFVPGPCYASVKGKAETPRTALVFAERGCGKSAFRMMIHESCRPRDRESPILAVSHTDFTSLLQQVGHDPSRLTLDHHLRAILRSALVTLVCDLAEGPDGFLALSRERQGVFKWLVSEYASSLLRPSYLSDRLRDWGWPGEANLLEEAADRGSVEQTLLRAPESSSPRLRFLALLLSCSPVSPGDNLPSLEHFRELVALVRRIGLKAVYVLVDRVDELPETAVSSQGRVALLFPLLGNLTLMEMRHVAFKFFLPIELAEILQRHPGIRLDRLAAYELKWSEGDLTLMLKQRLKAYSGRDKPVESLSQVVDDSIRSSLDQDLVRWAFGCPRNLLLFGDLLFSAHHDHMGPDKIFITAEDLKWAREQYIVEYSSLVPPLVIDDLSGRVFRGRQEVTDLTAREFKLLAFLKRERGEIKSKDEVYLAVWETAKGASDEAIDSFISRVRKKIEWDPRNPVYLITERGRGYRLINAR